ncbi:oxysterol-binding protein [Tanacetum coccineum]|uniref:Oxysterol-binding protein n=1 Tax=Tanacetum coccineum TaxID=301880 RepID=A0ABQ4YNV9_9ASTR
MLLDINIDLFRISDSVSAKDLFHLVNDRDMFVDFFILLNEIERRQAIWVCSLHKCVQCGEIGLSEFQGIYLIPWIVSKDVGSLSKLKKVLCNEGFDNIFVRYMGELWVLLEFDNTKAKELFRDNVGVGMGSWFFQFTSSGLMDFTPVVRNCLGDVEVKSDVIREVNDENPSLKYPPGFTPSVEKNGSKSKDDQVQNISDNQLKMVIWESVHQASPKALKKISDSIGNSGGILCIWDPNSFRKDSVTVSDYFVIVRGVWIKSGWISLLLWYYATHTLMLVITRYYGIIFLMYRTMGRRGGAYGDFNGSLEEVLPSTDLKTFLRMQANDLMRILSIASFAVSGYASTEGRQCKPFNPLLGETYEAKYPDKGLCFFSEKVHGFVHNNRTGEKVAMLMGKWDEAMYYVLGDPTMKPKGYDPMTEAIQPHTICNIYE